MTRLTSTIKLAGLAAALLGAWQSAGMTAPLTGQPDVPKMVQQVQERRQLPGTYRRTPPRPGIVNGVPGSTMRRAGYIFYNGYWYPPSAFGSSSNSGRIVRNPGRPVPQH